jgi:hypothetical protein
LRLKNYNFDEDSKASDDISFDPASSVFRDRMKYLGDTSDEVGYKRRWNMLKEAINDVKDLDTIFWFKIVSF